MLKKSTNYINLISVIILIYLAFIPLKPSDNNELSIVSNSFSMALATTHIKNLSKQPHPIGSAAHKQTQSYIVKQLQNLGLIVKIQKTPIARSNDKSKYKNTTFAQVENIFAKISGTDPSRKALLLMSHYDSAANASNGAADAGTGVAVILEGVRAYLSENNKPKNDIIILISDAEEVGLLGAKAFAEKNAWSDNIGAVLNFEARGTSGSSYMFMETNSGNHNMLQQFNQSDVSFANSNSLAYSIYKFMPNDTDMTIFKKNKNILGYNFAFIDSYFNYHTSLDAYQNLSLDSVAHHAHYLMPMLRSLSQLDLTKLESSTDDVYFQVPYWKTIIYPFSATLPLSLIVLLFFIVTIFIGIKNKSIRLKQSITASIPLFKSIIVSAIATFVVLKLLFFLHPQFSAIYQGFTYNGYAYIILFSLLSISICFLFYRQNLTTHNTSELMVAPVLLWILFSFIFAQYLTGAHFFILIAIFGAIALFINIIVKKPQTSLLLLFFAPVVLVFTPFIQQLPVALGLMILPFSGILLILIIAPFIGCMQITNEFQINKWVFICALLMAFAYAEFHASTSEERPLPDSLYYLQDNQSKSAYWFSADSSTDKWNSHYLDKNILDKEAKNEFIKTNWHGAKFVSQAQYHNFLSSEITVLKDRRYFDKHIYQFKITNKRKITRMDLRTLNSIDILNLSINHESVLSNNTNNSYAKNSRIVKIFTGNSYEFTIDLEIKPEQNLNFILLEMSDNLLNAKQLNVPHRPNDIIAKPFIFSDMIITKENIKP